jgi:hypothetical protein
MKGGNETITRKSNDIINQFKRKMLNLDSGYDEHGRHEEQYRNFKRKKELEAEIYKRAKKRQKNQEYDDEDTLILKEEDKNEGEGDGDRDEPKVKKEKSDGMFIPQKNQFDFTYRPESRAVGVDKRVKPESVKGQFLRSMLKMKREYNSQQKATFAAVKPNLNPDKE